jgi:protein-L-isoaspartate(D-aspartate) O-methyltransferase
MIDTMQQRINMVDSQVRPSDVTDRRIIKAMLDLPREAFAPAPFQAMAYMDEALPITLPGAAGPPRALLAPRTLAKLVQLAELEPDGVVLDVGCGTGYSTALMAKIAGRVVAVEADAALAERAGSLLRDLGIGNARVMQASLSEGAASEAPFDAIVLEGAVPDVPQALLDQLKDGGRLLAVVAPGRYGRAQMWRRTGQSFASRAVFDVSADPLPGFAREPGFVF